MQLKFIDPGKPTQNAYIESFNGKFRHECLYAQNFITNSKKRRGIEQHAMTRCAQHYRAAGYKVTDVSAVESNDLLIEKTGQMRFVEVKGTQNAGERILLSRNEVDLARVQNGE